MGARRQPPLQRRGAARDRRARDGAADRLASRHGPARGRRAVGCRGRGRRLRRGVGQGRLLGGRGDRRPGPRVGLRPSATGRVGGDPPRPPRGRDGRSQRAGARTGVRLLRPALHRGACGLRPSPQDAPARTRRSGATRGLRSRGHRPDRAWPRRSVSRDGSGSPGGNRRRGDERQARHDRRGVRCDRGSGPRRAGQAHRLPRGHRASVRRLPPDRRGGRGGRPLRHAYLLRRLLQCRQRPPCQLRGRLGLGKGTGRPGQPGRAAHWPRSAVRRRSTSTSGSRRVQGSEAVRPTRRRCCGGRDRTTSRSRPGSAPTFRCASRAAAPGWRESANG